MVTRKPTVARESNGLHPVHLHVPVGENPINARAIGFDALKAVERGDAFTLALLGDQPRVGKKLVLGENGVRLVLLGGRVDGLIPELVEARMREKLGQIP